MAVAIQEAMARTRATVLVADLRNPAVESSMRSLYALIFSGVQVLDASDLYEAVFDRIPLSIVGERWLVENSVMAVGKRRIYDAVKRGMDLILGVALGLVSLVFYPFVALAIKLEDGGSLFVFQDRVGKNGKPIRIAKFRSMTANDSGSYGAEGKSVQRVTRVGRVIRLTRIDELPQLWSIIVGDQSLIGPRPELPALVSVYEKEIPFYGARHLIKPGLSGWAQIYHRAHPHHAVAVEDTKDKLSYDLFYVKNRSLALDLKIALQTLRALVSRQGV
jgi:lipopolysaccharide/colanic/teichoic acid biosynthesis glycosyltransferase